MRGFGHLAANLPPASLYKYIVKPRVGQEEGTVRRKDHEWWLVIRGDPETAARLLGQLLRSLDARGYDTARSRAGAMFDSGFRGYRPAESDDEVETETRTAEPSSSQHRARSRSPASQSHFRRREAGSGRNSPQESSRSPAARSSRSSSRSATQAASAAPAPPPPATAPAPAEAATPSTAAAPAPTPTATNNNEPSEPTAPPAPHTDTAEQEVTPPPTVPTESHTANQPVPPATSRASSESEVICASGPPAVTEQVCPAVVSTAAAATEPTHPSEDHSTSNLAAVAPAPVTAEQTAEVMAALDTLLQICDTVTAHNSQQAAANAVPSEAEPPPLTVFSESRPSLARTLSTGTVQTVSCESDMQFVVPRLEVPSDDEGVFEPPCPSVPTAVVERMAAESLSWAKFFHAVVAGELALRDTNNWATKNGSVLTVLDQVRSSLQRETSEPTASSTALWPPEDVLGAVHFCSTSFRRDWVTKHVLAVNLWSLLPYRGHARIFLVTFAEDKDLQDWVAANLSWAVEAGLLLVASGGECWSAPGWIPTQADLPRLEYWHASVAKNTAHRFALSEQPASVPWSSTLLVNLDSDNLLGSKYVPALTQTAASSRAEWGLRPSPVIKGGNGALFGRIAVWAKDFCALGGYDEEPGIFGSGALAAQSKVIYLFRFLVLMFSRALFS